MATRRTILAVLTFALLAVPSAWAAPGTVWVKTTEAELRSGTSMTGPVVATVPKGTALTVVQEERLRYLVRTANGTEGWVSRLKVSDAAPSSGGLGGLVRDDRSPQEMRTAATNRGLVSESAEGVSENPNAAADLQQMEAVALNISEAEVTAFMKDGGVGQ